MAWHLLLHPSCSLPSYSDLRKVQAQTGSIYLCKDTCKTMWEYNAESYSWTEVRKVKEDRVERLYRTDRIIEVDGYQEVLAEEEREREYERKQRERERVRLERQREWESRPPPVKVIPKKPKWWQADYWMD